MGALAQNFSNSDVELKFFVGILDFVDVLAVPFGVVIESIAPVTLFRASSITQPENVKATVVAKAMVESFILYPLIFRLNV